ncbi:MobF family relaxase [Nonomuraea helvata]
MLSMSTGYDPGYLTATAAGAENYYLSAAGGEHGEPPGRWTGNGCAKLGLTGNVDPDVMKAIYAHLEDPRDPSGASTLGKAPRRYKSAEEVLAAKLENEPNATPERIKALTLEASKDTRSAVLFHDATFSPAKSVSLMHAGFQAAAMKARAAGDVATAERMEGYAEQVWAAVRAGSAAAMEYLQEEAGYSRTGYHGAIPRDPVTGRKLADHSTGQFVEAKEWVIASFDQHTSRNGDPQLHIHNAILNRVECPDGEWRTIDSRGMRKARPAAAAIAERVMEEQLTRDFGVKFATRPDGKAREIVGISQEQRDLYSSRRATVTAQVAALAAEYEAKHGHAPSRRALFNMAQYATLDSKTRMRKNKEAAPREVSLAGWEAQSRAAELGALADIPEAVQGRIDLSQARSVAELAEHEFRRVLQAAVAEVQATGATWTRYQLTAAINRHLPDTLGGLPARMVRDVLEDLTAEALAPGAGYGIHQVNAPDLVRAPAEYQRADGRSVWEPHERGLYTTRTQLAAEEELIGAGAKTDAPRLEPGAAAAALGGDSVTLEGLLSGASSARGRAGSATPGADAAKAGEQSAPGSTQGQAGTAQPTSAAAPQWTGGLRDDQAAAVYGVLTSGRRVDVLVGPAGAGKSRAMGELSATWREKVGGQVIGVAVAQAAAEVLKGEGCDTTANVAAFLTEARAGRTRLNAGDLVVVDEASMVTSGQLAEIQRMTAAAGAKLLLTGDPEQLAAVGDSGALAMMAREHGYFQLTKVQRMAAEWERKASLAMRRGEVSSLAEYDKHGRLMDGNAEAMTEEAYRRWLADHLEGKSSLLLAPTVEQARELAARARAELVALGKVSADGLPLSDDAVAGVGDRIMARRNEKGITDADDRKITNRDVLVVDALTPDGVIVRRDLGRDSATGQQRWSAPYEVNAAYLQDHAELAYASTVHASQGRTVDTCHSLVTPGVGRSMLYVMMTRGVEGNYAYAVTDVTAADLQAGAVAAAELAEAARAAAREAAPVPTPEQARAEVAEARAKAAEEAAEAKQPQRDRFAVLAEAIVADEAELTAIETIRDEHLRSTHLAHLGVMWTDVTRDLSARDCDATVAEALSAEQYARYADDSERGPRGTFHRLVRSAELAGHDVGQLIRQAVGAREIDDPGSPAESVAKVLHHRIKKLLGTDAPAPLSTDTFAERTPTRGAAEHVGFAEQLAAAMDARMAEIGERVAERAPEWAIEHLGPVPVDPVAREDWTRRAGRVEAFREQYDRLDESTAIGHAPDTPEARAAWWSAFDALGRPETEREAASRTDGELWVQREEYARAARWAPPYVGDDLRDTTIAAERARAEAILTRQRAEVESDQAQREALEVKARARESLAEALDARRTDLEAIDEARDRWYSSTERAREDALQADQELRRRHPEAELPALHDEPARAEIEPEEVERVEQVRGQLALELEDIREAEREQADRGEAEREQADRGEAEREQADRGEQTQLDLGIGELNGRQVAEDLTAAAEAAKAAQRAAEREEERKREQERDRAEREERDIPLREIEGLEAVRQEPQRRREDERARSIDHDHVLER